MGIGKAALSGIDTTYPCMQERGHVAPELINIDDEVFKLWGLSKAYRKSSLQQSDILQPEIASKTGTPGIQ